MQAASARTCQGIYLPRGRSCPPSLRLGLISPCGYFVSQGGAEPGEEPNATPFALLALLLFALPLEFTLQKFVEDDANGDRSHQLAAARLFTGHNL